MAEPGFLARVRDAVLRPRRLDELMKDARQRLAAIDLARTTADRERAEVGALAVGYLRIARLSVPDHVSVAEENKEKALTAADGAHADFVSVLDERATSLRDAMGRGEHRASVAGLEKAIGEDTRRERTSRDDFERRMSTAQGHAHPALDPLVDPAASTAEVRAELHDRPPRQGTRTRTRGPSTIGPAAHRPEVSDSRTQRGPRA